MDRFRITGGRRLAGELTLSGSKNAALPMLAATLLVRGESVLHNIPKLRDVDSMCRLLEVLGARIKREGHTVIVDSSGIDQHEAPYDVVRKMRASIYVLGPLVAHLGRARVSLPGGCAWGPRPVNLHLQGLRAMGADISLEHGYIEARAQRLRGASIAFDVVSVGATANLMMAATLADGTTTISNASREPHVIALGEFLGSMGAEVSGLGTHTVSVTGVDRLEPAEAVNRSDYIEAGTMAAAAVITGGALAIRGGIASDCGPVLERLRETGADVSWQGDLLHVSRSGPLRPIQLTTAPHPGFPTDVQAQLMAVLSIANGTSVITEGIYADRFTHVPELGRMGARITVRGNVAVIHGVPALEGAPVMATDIRASAAMVLAALVAEGETVVNRVYHIDRGYEKIEAKLNAVGADVERLDS